MKTISCFSGLLISLLCATPASRASEAVTTNMPFDSIGGFIVALLETGDVNRFTEALAFGLNDWQLARPADSESVRPEAEEKAAANLTTHYRQQLAMSAERLLADAASLGLDQSRLQWTIKEIAGNRPSTFRAPGFGGVDRPFIHEVRVILVADAGETNPGAKRFAGEYELSVRMLAQLPAGWKCMGTIAWERFPAGVENDFTRQRSRILARVNAYQPLTEQDDPTLVDLGRAVVHLMKTKDIEAFKTGAVVSIDDVLKKFESRTEGQRPTGTQLETWWKTFLEAMFAPSAAEFLNLANKAGIDLSDADVTVQSIATSPPQSRDGHGTIDGLMAEHVRVTMNVVSKRKSASGQPLSGEYVIDAEQAERLGGTWKVQKGIRWQKVPDALLDPEQKAAIGLENYVAEHGRLPSGMDAPDIEFVRIGDETRFRLSDFRGKVVVLEFWATWCGPCQEPMAKMQTYPARHPEWKDKVELITLSLDDQVAAARDHLAKNGWTNTLNAWAPGGWQSPPAKDFRVRGVPTLYVVGADGKIVESGHPESVQISETIKSQLR